MNAQELRSPFRSARAEAEYLAAYEASLRRWPIPYEEFELESRFGGTHVIASGPRDAPVVVLLHGYGVSSTMWAADVGELARRYRVYALDVLGQAGKSRPRLPLATRADCVEWITSALDALAIDEACLVGMSYGGWLTLNQAIAVPQRLRAIALLAPGGLLPLSPQMRLRAMLASLVPLQLGSDLLLLRWMTSSHGAAADADTRPLRKLVARQMYLGFRIRGEYMRGGADALPFSDDELRSLRVPTLLLIGEEEVLYDPVAALSRARRLIPDLAGELIPQMSHWMLDKSRIIEARLLAFLAAVDERRPPAPVGGEPAPLHA